MSTVNFALLHDLNKNDRKQFQAVCSSTLHSKNKKTDINDKMLLECMTCNKPICYDCYKNHMSIKHKGHESDKMYRWENEKDD